MNDIRIEIKRPVLIRTPDYRLRIFVSSTLKELADERLVVRQAVEKLHLSPVMFESGARPHPPQDLYQSYLSQSHIFIGIYWQSYGWISPGAQISGLEDEYNLSENLPRLMYVKNPAPDRETALNNLLDRIKFENSGSYKSFTELDELRELVENDLILLLTEYFETARQKDTQRFNIPPLPPSNVPIPRNTLVDRKKELKEANDLLLREDVGLVTLSGPGGSGKSRLGIEIALGVQKIFSDGVFLVALESIHDPNLVIPTIAKILGITETAGDPPLFELLKSCLCGKQILLLLDNFEQVLEAAPQISELLESCPQMKIIATSRAPLRLRAEKVLLVLPLAVPPINGEFDLIPLLEYPAAQLFVQRAQGVKPDFTVTNENETVLAQLCNKLDGLPLAIELAAARVNMLPPKPLLHRLDQRFEVLRGGTRDLPERQHTLFSAVDWSYNLLNDREKQVFRRLAVFMGGWTLESAESICSDKDYQPQEVSEILGSLLEINLVKPPDENNRDLRMSMFETIRQYAAGQLAQSTNEEYEIRKKHTNYFLKLAELAAPEIRGGNQELWLTRLENELDNLRAAINYSFEKEWSEITLRFGSALWRFWIAHGYIREGRRWMDTVLRRLASSNAGNVPESLLVAALNVAGCMARVQGDLSQANNYHQKALDLSRQMEDKRAIGRSLNRLAIAMIFSGSYPEAKQLLEESLENARKRDDEIDIVFALNNLGVTEMYLFKLDRALQIHEEVLRTHKKRQDKQGIAGALGNMGDVLRLKGDFKRAQNVLLESLDLMKEIGDKQDKAITLASLGRLSLDMNDEEKCEKYYIEAMVLLREVDDRTAMPDAFEGLAAASCLRAAKQSIISSEIDLKRAVKLSAAAEELRNALGSPLPPTDQAAHELTQSIFKKQLDAGTFEQAWRKGREMTLAQAIEFALEINVGDI